MRILFICDLNSVHSQKWIRHFAGGKHEVHIYSTTPFRGDFLGAKVFSNTPEGGQPADSSKGPLSALLRMRVATVAVPIAEKAFLRKKISDIKSSTFTHRDAVEAILPSVKPDVIHCLRIPNEGFTGTMLRTDVPLAVSTWGNDLTYWGQMTEFRQWTEDTLKRANFLFSDCERDVRLARDFGFARSKPSLVIPGSGGMMTEDLEAGRNSPGSRTEFFGDNFGISGRPLLLSLRGFGSQDIDNIPLLKACRMLLNKGTDFRLVIAGRKDGFRFHKLTRFIEAHKLAGNVFLVEEMPHARALEALRGADFSISISHNDGTPNSMLEAMTFGAVPLMSGIESIKEWISDGTNGYLFDPFDPKSIADAVMKAVSDEGRLSSMRRLNYDIVKERADYAANMSKAEEEMMKLAGTAKER